jgi:hypothetical protein
MICSPTMAQQGTTNVVSNSKAADLRRQLVEVALEWESYFGVAPSITSSISELDAALLVGMKEDTYCADGKLRTAVSKDTDFICERVRYQVTANRPSGKKGSLVTLVSQKNERKKPFGWDRILWILYDRSYVLQEAWEFTAEEYRTRFKQLTRLSPDHMRQGRCLARNSN